MIYHAKDNNIFASVPQNWIVCYALFLNPMADRVENRQLVAVSDTEVELVDFLAAAAVLPYKDGEWYRSYKEPLKWFNPPGPLVPERQFDYWGCGIMRMTRDNCWRVNP